MENWHRMFFSNRTIKCNKKQTHTIFIRSHQNETCNLSPAIIQPQVERRPLTGLQFDVQRKIKLILGESHFRASDSSVVTFAPRNRASKSNFRKHCCLCYDEIGSGQKMQKQNITNHEISVKHAALPRVFGTAYKFALYALIDAEICFTTNSNSYIE